MPVCLGEVWHSDGRVWDSASQTYKIQYRKTEMSVEVPVSGRITRSLQCPVCGDSFNIVLRSGRWNGLTNGVWLAILFCIFAGAGWALIAADISDSFLWIPRLLLCGIAPLFAGGLIYTMIFGACPTSELPPNEKMVSEGGKHSFHLKTSFSPVQFWGTLGVAVLLGVMLGYRFT